MTHAGQELPGVDTSQKESEVHGETIPSSFVDAFTPLAYHIFPDGCPCEEFEGTWPRRDTRAPVSANDADKAMERLERLAQRQGLLTMQLQIVAFVACALLPSTSNSRYAATTVVSPLVDGTSRSFQRLLRTLIPQTGQAIPRGTIAQLVGVGSNCDGSGRCRILQFLALVICYSTGTSPDALRQLDALYGLIFPWVLDPITGTDAVRVLLPITKRSHVRVHRAQRLYKACTTGQGTTDRGWDRSWAASVRALLQLYGNYDPAGCGEFVIHVPDDNHTFQFRDRVWELSFRGDHPDTLGTGFTPVDLWLHDDANQWHLLLPSNRGLDRWMLEPSFRHRLLLESDHDAVVVDLRELLPVLLHDEFFLRPRRHHHDTAIKPERKRRRDPLQYQAALRLQLLGAMAEFADCTGALPPGSEPFLLREVLPLWDGTDGMGQLLCFHLVPKLNLPSAGCNLRNDLLLPLERLFVYGSPRLQYSIIAGALAGLIVRWGHLDWSPSDDALVATTEGLQSRKNRVLRDLIRFTDDLLLKGCISESSELLKVAAVEFYFAVCELTAHCEFVLGPSPAIMYHLLLSPSALSIDLACSLLVQYKSAYLTIRQKQGNQTTSENETGLDGIQVFDSFVSDFCSTLWHCSPPPFVKEGEASPTQSVSILYRDVRREIQSKLEGPADQVSSALSISHGAAFCAYTEAFVGRHYPESLPLPSSSLHRFLQGKLKVEYLDYLKGRGLQGIHNFVSIFVFIDESQIAGS